MPVFVFQDTPLDEGIVEVFPGARNLHKPVICCAADGPYTRSMSRRVQALSIPVYGTAERTVDATPR